MKYLIIILSLVILLGYGWFYYYQKKLDLASPVLGISRSVLADNVWFPREATAPASYSEKELANITARAAFFVDTSTGEVLFEKNIHQKMPIASLTKIMTSIIALENRDLSDQLYVTKEAADTEPDKMFLKSGEKLTVEELLKGLFLVSANDAAEVFARETTGRREEFINLMNSKANLLGMKNTLFINPSGLQEDDTDTGEGALKTQYSTAYDVALMARYAIRRWPKLITITSQPHILIPETATHQDYDLYSGINLLTTYPGVMGFKTGFTPEAGLTLVTFAKRDNREVLGVLLGSTDRRDDARALLDYSYKKLGVKVND